MHDGREWSDTVDVTERVAVALGHTAETLIEVHHKDTTGQI